MPISWMPQIKKIEEEIAEEEARIETLKLKRVSQAPVLEPAIEPTPEPVDWMARTMEQYGLTPLGDTITDTRQPLLSIPQIETRQPIEQVKPVSVEIPKEAPVQVPFWQRALQIFATPFQWVDENVIEPGLAVLGTTAGFVSEVEREPGEDFWEWKKRSWQGWDSPGINLNVPWSDEPWRVDMRGVMELAPWLLIPGVGTVGRGATAARGIAGILSKTGRVGRVLGTAVEYSPWGLVEKTAGAAIKGGFRAAGKISERISTPVGEKLFGKYIPPPVPESVTKLTNYFKEAVIPARKAFKRELPGLRIRQEKGVQSVFTAYRKGEIPFDDLQARLNEARGGALTPEFALNPKTLAARQERAVADIEARVVSGELTEKGGNALITEIRKSPAFTAKQFTGAEVKELNDAIIGGVESGLVKADSADAFLELMLSGKLPQPHHIRDWANVFGIDFAKAVGKLNVTPGVSGSQLVDTLNLPRALLASADLSGTLRQGLILGLLHPTKVPVWFGKQIKAFVSEKLALDMDDMLRARPLYKDFVSSGGYIAPIRDALPTRAEELFMSNFARQVPLVRRSERAFITYLNEARMTSFEAAHGAMAAQGATAEQFKVMAEFINMASGRGNLPKTLEKYSPVLNTVLFSPRLQAATLQLPRQIGRMFLSKNPYMRKEAAKALVTFIGGGSAVLGLLKATGRSKVELDPRSGDFGKIIIGETRLDIWRGYIQYARLAAQLLTGERKSAYGNMNAAERSEIAWRFLQSKSSPGFGLMVDLLRGETYMGDPIFNDTTGFIKVAREKILPLAIQDTIDAMQQSGINGLWVAAPATLGVGALTYVNDFVRIKERIAGEMGYDSWDDIDPKTQREIQNRNAELQAATIAFDRQVMGTAWGDWKLAGNAIEDVFRQNVENATNQFRETKDGYQFREKISDAWTARQGGYQAREQEARFEDIVKRLNVQDTAESLISLGPEQLAIKVYNDALFGDDMYDEFGDYYYDEATLRKEQLRKMLGEEMFNYIEDYRELKFETFPPEFQELMHAKEILRPYWEVKNEVVKLFGQRFADSNKGQSLVTKLRKNKRMSDPEMQKYYNLFYVQNI